MRIVILTGIVVAAFGLIAPAGGAPPTDDARVTALADCNRQARAKQFGRRYIQRRNFVKDCMIDRGFPAQIN